MNFNRKTKMTESGTQNKPKFTTAEKVKIGVMASISLVVGAQFLGFNSFGYVKGMFSEAPAVDDRYAKLGSLTATTSPAPMTTLPISLPNESSTVEPSTSSKPTSPPKPGPTSSTKNKNEATTKDDMSFVVAPDYRTVLAAVQLIDNAVNSDVEKQWVALRLQLNAERERNRIAQIRLSRTKADAEAAEYRKQTKDILDQIESSDTVVTTTSTSSEINLLSVNSNYVDLMVDGKSYSFKGVDSVVGNYKITKIDSNNACASFKHKNANVTKVCI